MKFVNKNIKIHFLVQKTIGIFEVNTHLALRFKHLGH